MSLVLLTLLTAIAPYCCPPPLSHLYEFDLRVGYVASVVGARYASPRVITAHAIRAVLLASATMTSIGGFRASIPDSQAFGVAPLRLAHRTTPEQAMISKRLRVRSPIRDVRPIRCFPPVDFCRGVRPIQAAKSRPELNVSAGGASASKAVAIRGPTPGIVIESARGFVPFGASGDFDVKSLDLGLKTLQSLNKSEQTGASLFRNRGGRIFDLRDQLVYVDSALRSDEPELAHMAAQRIDDLGSLSDEKIAGSENYGRGLFRLALHGDEAHRWPLSGLTYCLSVGHVVFLPLHERLNVSRWDQAHVMP